MRICQFKTGNKTSHISNIINQGFWLPNSRSSLIGQRCRKSILHDFDSSRLNIVILEVIDDALCAREIEVNVARHKINFTNLSKWRIRQ